MFKFISYVKMVVLLIILLFISLPASAAVYTYDALNRLTSVTYQNGQKIVYTYDPGGNMLSVSHHSSPDTTPPTVKNTSPADGAKDVSVSASENCIM
ncbi:MAG: hypothetical protein M1489_04310 [Firmicutes bacterium]|nr:hypothetical protein [Bacillota bacterium]